MVTDTSKPETKFPLSDFEISIGEAWMPLEEMASQCGMQVGKMRATPADTGYLCVASVDSTYMIGELYLSNWRWKPSEYANILKGVGAGSVVVCW